MLIQLCPANKRRRGFTLTEIAIVLGVIGIILGAVWAAASKVYSNNRINTATQEIMTLVDGVRQTYSVKGYVDTGILTQTLITAGLYPTNMLQGAGCGSAPSGGDNPVPCPLDPWGGEVEASGGGAAWPCMSGACGANDFNIVLWGLTTNCTAFLISFVPAATMDGLVGVYSDTQGEQAVSTSTSTTSPIITQCGGNIVLEFQL